MHAQPDDVAIVAAAQTDDERAPDELIDAYLAGSRTLRRAVEDLDAGQLASYPVAGKMSVIEVVGHLCDCEQFLCDRMKRTIATDRPLLLGVDGSLYVEALHYSSRDVALQLDLIDLTRRQMAEDLGHLGDEAWTRTAVHSETGILTLRQLLLHTVRHLERHVEAIAEKRRALGM